ncbi:MAG TPA: TIGR03067 domain-containing protein, partial [Gemmataceae bacterium]|nr:TIGR03067 domain-containing protein [Gemmataceae bacterium]
MPHTPLLLLVSLAFLEGAPAPCRQQPSPQHEVECDVPKGTSKRPRGADTPVVWDAKLEGTWAPVSGKQGGDELPAELVKGIKLAFQGGKLRLEVLGMVRDGTYKVDRSTRPISIDLTVDGQTLKGIFVVREDTLTLCV